MTPDRDEEDGDGRPAPRAEVVVRRLDERWEETLADVARRSARAALADNRLARRGMDFAGFEIAVALADDARVRALNARHRGRDAATDVLSFPVIEEVSVEGLAAIAAAPGDEPAPLGDVVVAYETTARDAARLGRPLAHHLAHLVVHGVLHCLGHDHERRAEAEEMEALERRILARLGVPDPWREAARDGTTGDGNGGNGGGGEER